ncbi:MAG: hypothetical protein AAB262_07385 [Elusimicrobiota bacterium]
MVKSSACAAALIVVASIAIAQASLVAAGPQQPAPVLAPKVAPAEFLRTLQMVREEIKPGGRWEYVPSVDRPGLEASMKTMEALLAGRDAVDSMSEDDKMRLFNAQERINAILARNDGQRVVCEMVKPTGSHNAKRLCLTYAEKRLMQEDAASTLERLPRGSKTVGR